MKGKRRGLVTGPPVTHQATQAGTGGGDGALPDFGGREPAKAPPSVLDNWLTLEGFLDTPREYWDFLARTGAIAEVPSKRELESSWKRWDSIRMQFLRDASNPRMSLEDIVGKEYTHAGPLAVTPPYDNRSWNTVSFVQWLMHPLLRRSVRVNTFGSSGTGYVVGPRHVLTCSHILPWYDHTKKNWTGPIVGEDRLINPILQPIGSPWSFGARVYFGYGTLLANNKEYTTSTAQVNLNGVMSHSAELIYAPSKPNQENSGQFYDSEGGSLGDVVILIMGQSFQDAMEEYGIGWNDVLPSVPANANFMRTGWGGYDADDYPWLQSFEMKPPPPPFSGPPTTSRSDIGFQLKAAGTYGKGEWNAYSGTILETHDGDASRGDSGSSVVTLPGFSPKGTPFGVAGIFISYATFGYVVDDPTGPGWSALRIFSVNKCVSGWAIYVPWLTSRLMFE